MSNTTGTTSLFHEFRKQELSDRENEMKIKINSDEKERIFKKVSDAHAGVLVEMKSPNDKTSWVVNVPDGCEIESYDIKDGKVIVIFDCQNDEFPKSWEEFCENNPLKNNEISIDPEDCTLYDRSSCIENPTPRDIQTDILTFQDRATAEALIALCKLIRLRDHYNKGWIPDWHKGFFSGYRVSYINIRGIYECKGKFEIYTSFCAENPQLLYFKDQATASEFLRNFRTLIEKLKPLYGVKE